MAGVDPSTLVPTAGLGSVIVLLVGYLLRQLVADRRDYREQLVDEQARTAAAEARLVEERARADQAQERVDAERAKRRQADKQAAVADAELAGCRALVRWYSREVDRLRPFLPPGPFLPDEPHPGDPPVGG